jgi:hypothetical protein
VVAQAYRSVVKRVVVLVAWLGCHAQPAPASGPITFFVAPGGNDRASGRADAPFATLERARDAVRALHGRHDAVVELRGGMYVRRAPFVLTAEDSAGPGHRIVYRAAPDATVRIVGGPVLPAFTAVTDPALVARIPTEARGHVVQIDLTQLGLRDFGRVDGGGLELFFEGQPMTIARWPNSGFAHVRDVVGGEPFEIRGNRGDHVGRFTYDGERPDRWVGEPDVWLHGYWFWDWAESREQVASIDPKQHVIALEPPYHQYGYRAGQWFYAFNVLAELDAPGEWYLDRQRGVLLFWPPRAQGEAIVSATDQLLELRGASRITFRGLTFEAARTTAISVEDGRDDEIEACTIRNVGGWAVQIRGGARDGVDHCEIASTGLGGISLAGGDRATLTPADHHAIGNHIHDYSRWKRTLQPAIALDGVGLRAAHNHIHDAPHQAIAFSGNDHVIEGNDIHDVCEETRDAGAIYASRDWTARGTQIRNNIIHDIHGFDGQGAVGVYLDDMLSGTTVEHNIFDDVTRAVFIGGGRDNVIERNVFTNCATAIHVDARGLDWAAYSVEQDMMPRLHAVPYTSERWRARYPSLSSILENHPAAPRGNTLAHNLFDRPGWDEIGPVARPLLRFEGNEVSTAP